MFSIILRKAGFRRTFSPFLFQTQDFKREVVPSDLDPSHPDNPFNKEKEKQKEKKELKMWKDKSSLAIPEGTYIH